MRTIKDFAVSVFLGLFSVFSVMYLIGPMIEPKDDAQVHDKGVNSHTLKNVDYDSYFNKRISDAHRSSESGLGRTYEKVFRESTWDKDSECFNFATRNGGAVGYYQLVAIIKLDGGASNIEFRPKHTYSECMYKWFLKHKFPRPPTDNWPIAMEIDVQP